MSPLFLTLWTASWQGGLALLLIWAICRWCRLPPSAQCWLWRIGQIKLLLGLLPLAVSLPLLAPPPSGMPTQKTAAPVVPVPIAREQIFEANFQANTIAPVVIPSAPESRSTLVTVQQVVVGVWLIGVVWYCVRLGQSALRTRRLLRGAMLLDRAEDNQVCQTLAEELGRHRAPRLLLSDAVQSPLLVGICAPTIVLPRVFWASASGAERRLVLAHELAHVARCDLWWQGVWLVTRTLFFFHPLVWIACREERTTREVVCDGIALRLTGDSPARYGALLVRIAAGNRRDSHSLVLSAGTVEKGEVLMKRLNLLGTVGTVRTRPPLRLAVGIVVGVGAVLVPWRLTAQTLPPTKTSQVQVTPRRVSARPVWGNRVVQGRVTDTTGRPVAGALLYAHEINERAHTLGASFGDATTDAEGNYKITGLSHGTHLVSANNAPNAVILTPSRVINLQTGNMNGVNFNAAPAALVKGRVQSRSTNKGLAGVHVMGSAANTTDREHVSLATTDAEGFCTVQVPIGQAVIELQNGFGLSLDRREPQDRLRKTVVVKAGENPLVVFPVSATVDASFSGRLLDEEGKSVSGAQLYAGSLVFGDLAKTKPDGSFNFSVRNGAPQGVAEPVQIWVRQGARSATTIVTPGKDVTLRLNFVHNPPAQVRGRILGANGKPLAGATVQSVRFIKSAGAVTDAVKTDALGNYTFAAYAEFRYRVFVQAKGYGTVMFPDSPAPTVFFTPGSSGTLPDVHLPPATGWVGGQVVDPSGQPVAEAVLTVRGEHSVAQGKTDQKGYFKFGGIVRTDHLTANINTLGMQGGGSVFAGRADNRVMVLPSR